MNFKESYYASVNAGRTAGPNPSLLIPDTYVYLSGNSLKEQLSSDFLHLSGGGKICTDLPISFSFCPLKYGLILYTETGCGTLSGMEGTISIPEKALTFLDCSCAFSLYSNALPWNFILYFFNGRDMELYRRILTPLGSSLKVSEYSSVKKALYSLLSVPTHPDISDIIFMHKNLSEILGSLCLSKGSPYSSDEKTLPDYLIQMHDILEFQYNKPFSLEMCEDFLHVSKYRLCREFPAVYGMPPVKYLIGRRLEEARKMLLTTDWPIHEISSKVGYNNVNHFINLFKKDTGLTPGNFRQKVREDQSLQHCFFQ